MIDLLSYTTMDLHAAWPVAGCRSSSRLLGACVASSSSNVMSGSRQLRGTHVPSCFVALGGYKRKEVDREQRYSGHARAKFV